MSTPFTVSRRPVAIEQRTSRRRPEIPPSQPLTEIYHFLRLLYVKLGTQYCPTCNVPVIKQSKEQIFASIMKAYKGKEITFLAPLVKNRKGFYKDLAVWARNKGYEHLIATEKKSLPSAFLLCLVSRNTTSTCPPVRSK